MNKSIECLLVDDQEDHRFIIKNGLEKLDSCITLDFAFAAEDAFEKIRSKKYDVILTDYLLSGMNGLQLIGTLKSQGSDVPVIFITNYGDGQICRDCFQSGAYDYFSKTIVFAHFLSLLNSIKRAIEKKKKEESIIAANKILEYNNRKLQETMELIKTSQ
jgi:DNA-binding NtrC family response regulator